MPIDRAKVRKNADQFLAKGHLDKAIEEYRKLLDDNPQDFNLMNQVGDVCAQANRNDEATNYWKKCSLGYQQQGFVQKAIAVLKKVPRVNPDDIDTQQRLANLYRSANMIKDAIQVYLQVADHFSKKGLLKRALEEFSKVVDLDPKNLNNKVKLADLYNKEGQKEEASTIYLEVAESLAIDQRHAEAQQILDRVKAMSNTPKVFLTQSRLFVIQGDLKQAASKLRDGVKANPGNLDLIEALAEMELRVGNPDRALEALCEIRQIPEKFLSVCEKALRALLASGRLDEGVRLFSPMARELARRGSGEVVIRSIRSAVPNHQNAEVYSLLAEIAHESGNKEQRIYFLQNAFSLSNAQGDTRKAEEISKLLESLGALTTAEGGARAGEPGLPPSFEQTQTFVENTKTGTGAEIEQDPVKNMKIEQIEREATALVRGGALDKALETYKRILEIEPGHFTTIEKIVDIHRTSGMLGRAQMQYVQSGQALAKAGRTKEACRLFDEAERLFPGSTRIYRRTLGLPEYAPVSAPPTPPPPQPPPIASQPIIAPPPTAQPAIALPSGTLPGIELSTDSLPGIPLSSPLPAPSQTPPPPAPPEVIPIQLGFEPLPIPVIKEEPPLPEFLAPPLASSAGIPLEAPSELDFLQNELNSLPAAPTPSLGLPVSIPLGDGLRPEAPTPPIEAFHLPALPMSAPPSPVVPVSKPTPSPILPPPPLFALPEPIPMPPAAGPVSEPAAPEEVEIPIELESILSEIDFQLDYGSPEEAESIYSEALRAFPAHPALLDRGDAINHALRKLGHEKVEAAAQEEGEFSDSFFDLTDVLGTALMDSGEGEEIHDASKATVEKIHTVEELFSAFREGVEKQVKGDDYDTHYNLGIAYKEMMLVEPAIEEFKIAMQDPERTLECCSMLSICEQLRGDNDQAIQWLMKGIEAPGFPPEDSIGLRYDLGELFENLGQKDKAMEQFRVVQGIDSEYRNVATKVKI